jgi:hypothetical protein
MNTQKAMTPVSILRQFFSPLDGVVCPDSVLSIGEMKALSKDERMELATLCALEMDVTVKE